MVTMNKLPIGSPGANGDLGECQLCGECFIGALAAVPGEDVEIGRFGGQVNPEDLAFHKKCVHFLDGRPWEELPNGPIRRAFEESETSELVSSETDF